ncbi:MAG: hypothetical protein ACFFCF_08115 [Promethearchaeota archaeon]
MSRREVDSWPEELILIPIIFTLSGIFFTLMVATPSLPPPYYILLNSLYGSLGVIFIAIGVWQLCCLRIVIQAKKYNEEPDYQSTNRTFFIAFLLLLLILFALNLSNSFMIGIPVPPPLPPL